MPLDSARGGRQQPLVSSVAKRSRETPRPSFGSAWDAPLDDSVFRLPPLPGPEVIDLRKQFRHFVPAPPPKVMGRRDGGSPAPGSNNWAVAGKLTPQPGSLLWTHLPEGRSKRLRSRTQVALSRHLGWSKEARL